MPGWSPCLCVQAVLGCRSQPVASGSIGEAPLPNDWPLLVAQKCAAPGIRLRPYGLPLAWDPAPQYAVQKPALPSLTDHWICSLNTSENCKEDQAARCALAFSMTAMISVMGHRLIPPMRTGCGTVPSLTRRQKVALEQPNMAAPSTSRINLSGCSTLTALTSSKLQWGEDGRYVWDSGGHCPWFLGLSSPEL